jgi:indolepyruvate ferredoxin oxidoreductase
MKHTAVTLDEKYRTEIDRVFLTGTQALVRLPLLQRARDLAAGLNTAGFITGYRGSPLGGIDIQLWQARAQLAESHVHFTPALNEEIAATAVAGSQQVSLLPQATVEGVFSIWYGKGPGVDRATDALKHANLAGASRSGGVLVVAGDDHACKSSTIPHTSEPSLAAAMIPVLVPADISDILAFGLHGWAMSRWSGRFVGIKTVADVVESSGTVTFSLAEFATRWPEGPVPDVHIRPFVNLLDTEARLLNFGLPAALDYVRLNGLDRIVLDPPEPALGIVTIGHTYNEVRRALADLGDPPVRLLKLALAWPLDREIVRRFAAGLREVVVVEDKTDFIEKQVRDALYDLTERPRVVGRADETGATLLPWAGQLSAEVIGLALARRLPQTEAIEARRRLLEAQRDVVAQLAPPAVRKPYFCSGCPHNTSTKVIDGSRAMAGIGCHTLAIWMNRSSEFPSQMGGEGAFWLGQAPFTQESHVFANIGDGTYMHSGLLSIRAAVAAGVNITFKLLVNDAVAMTGGQPVDGTPTVPQLTRQLAAEGVARIAVVTDQPEKHDTVSDFAPGVTVHHRRDLDAVQRTLRDTQGVTALVYDQTCAAEKRRRRKRGTLVDPQMRTFINEAVCEGCGDCSVASNCLSVAPVETPLGTKRRIDQSTCNKDFSCVEGFCPSFVTVHGGTLRKRARTLPDETGLPEPAHPALDRPWSILVTGIGGTGVVTIGALLGMAAHADGVRSLVQDSTGLSQKGGSVWSHIRLAAEDTALHGARVGAGQADLVLGCDLVVTASPDSLATIRRGASRVVLNANRAPTADNVLDPDFRLPAAKLRRNIEEAAGADHVATLDATALAAALMGDAIASNIFLLGYAWQSGLIPLSHESLLHAIDLNGASVETNKAAFGWGRCAAHDLPAVLRAAGLADPVAIPRTLDEIVAHREQHLTDYQGRRYARRYAKLVAQVAEVEARMFSGATPLAEAVARNYARLLAYKDEYEVARLYRTQAFRDSLESQFEGYARVEYRLAPPLVAARDPRTGHLRKRVYGPWVQRAFAVLVRLKRLRGTPLDPFGRTEERRAERRLIAEYEADIAAVLAKLTPARLPHAVALASLPERIRGYGHVKARAMREAAVERTRLLALLEGGEPPRALPLAAE